MSGIGFWAIGKPSHFLYYPVNKKSLSGSRRPQWRVLSGMGQSKGMKTEGGLWNDNLLAV